MSAAPPDTQPLTNQIAYDDRYVQLLREHITETSLHLAGTSPDGPLPSSVAAPAAHWTAREKDAFFRALATHSRLRPDLIAARVGSKSAFDVCAYRDALEAAARAAALPPRARADAPAALDASAAWAAAEDAKAAAAAAAEPGWAAAGTKRRREAERITGRRAPKAVKTDAASADVRAAQLAAAKAAQQSEWAREDLLARLEAPHLRAMDAMLRDAEEEDARAVKARHAPPDAPRPGRTPQPENGPVAGPSRSSFHGLASSSSSPPSPAGPARAHVLPSSGHPPPDLFEAPLPGPSDASVASGSHSDAAVKAHADPAAALTQLSPGARRRHQKRLYMRRRRAGAAPAADVSAHVGRLKPGRKPRAPGAPASLGAARRARDSGSGSDADSSVNSDSGEDADSAPAEDENADSDARPRKRKRGSVPGLRKEPAIRRALERVGVDSRVLRTAGLGLFRLAKLARLMGLFGELERTDTDDDETSDQPAMSPAALDGPALALLAAHLRAFVTDAAHRALVLARTEHALKQHTVVWRIAGEKGEITKEHVRAAVRMRGQRAVRLCEYFGGLLERLGVDDPDGDDLAVEQTEEADEDDEDDEDVNLFDGDPAAERSSDLDLDDAASASDASDADPAAGDQDDPADSTVTLSTHRSAHPPAVQLPFYPAAEEQLAEIYALSEADFEEAERAELADEAALDRLDEEAGAAAEQALWAFVAVSSRAPEGLEPAREEENGEELRTVLPGQDVANRVKSQVYVVDSD